MIGRNVPSYSSAPDAAMSLSEHMETGKQPHSSFQPSTTVPFLLLTYGRMLWGGAGDGSKGVFLQERVPSGGRICGTSPASGDPITPPFPEAGSSSARGGLPEGSHRRRLAQER